MGTPEFAVPALEKLVNSGHEVVAVYTRAPAPAGRGKALRKSPVHELAERHGIPVRTYASLKGEAEQGEFAGFRADVALVAAFGLLLPEAILRGAKYGCLNIHPSLLPRWRGAAPIQRAIIEGDKETGVCIMQMDKGLDTGDILAMQKYEIPAKMTTGGLHDVLAEMGAGLALQTIKNLGNIIPVKQYEEGVAYAKKITREDEKINWQQPAWRIEALIRGLQPRPGAYFIYKGERVKIIEADCEPPNCHSRPLSCHSRVGGNPYSRDGEVLAVTDKPVAMDSRLRGNDNSGTVLDENFTIACGEGILKPQKLQRPGKNALPIKEFLRGFPINPGEVLC